MVWGKGKPSSTVGGNVNWCSYYGKQYEVPQKNLKIELTHDPATPLLDMYPVKN